MNQSLNLQNLEAVCNIVADTNAGLSGSQLERLLTQCGIEHRPVRQFSNKRSMVYEALNQRQRKDGCANNVLAFIEAALNPSRFTSEHESFDALRDRLNQVLLFSGLRMGTNGKIERVRPATTLDEAAERANALRAKLSRMAIHHEAIKCCRKELLKDQNYFHSVFEASKGVADRIRQLSGCTSDGARLADDALAAGKNKFPILCLNTFRSSSEANQQNGLLSLVKALFGLYRNPLAHDPKLVNPMTEADALVAFQLISVIHNHLDKVNNTWSIMSNGTQVHSGSATP